MMELEPVEEKKEDGITTKEYRVAETSITYRETWYGGALKTATYHCPKCSTEIAFSDNYCRHCSFKLRPEVGVPQEAIEPQ